MGLLWKVKARQVDTAASMTKLVDFFYPIGRLYISNDSTSPATLYGGAWSSIQGYALVGHGGAAPLNGNVGTTYGAATHQLIAAEMPAHTHAVYAGANYNGSGYVHQSDNSGQIPNKTTSSAGGDGAHNNVQPSYLTYIWRRTA